jgi:L-glyceraldehyde 3-phosphate reductase
LQSDRIQPETIEKVKALNLIASARGQSLAQMALRWVMQHPTVCSVLAGASSVDQLKENVKLMDSPPLSAEELNSIDIVLNSV